MKFIVKIKKFFSNIGLFFKRIFGHEMLYPSEEKIIGMESENKFYNELRKYLPEAYIFPNVLLDKESAKGEIDFVVVYKTKVFVVELKRWRGIIKQDGDKFYQFKSSSSGETYINQLSNPFSQVRKNVFKIKQRFPNVWFEPSVVFLNSQKLEINENYRFFRSTLEFVDYVRNANIKCNNSHDKDYLVKNIECYDSIYNSGGLWAEEQCVIDEKCFKFICNGEIITKKEILIIDIEHHALYDKVVIELKNHRKFVVNLENYKISCRTNGKRHYVSFSKIRRIVIRSER